MPLYASRFVGRVAHKAEAYKSLARAAPGGGPWAFLALQQQFSPYHITQRLADILRDEDAPISEYDEELHELQ